MKYQEPKVIKEKSTKKENYKQFWQIFFIQGGLFLLTSFLVLIGAFKLNKLVQAKKIYIPDNSLQDFLISSRRLILVLLKGRIKRQQLSFKQKTWSKNEIADMRLANNS